VLERGGEKGLDDLLAEIMRKRDGLRAFIGATGGDGQGFRPLFEEFGFGAHETAETIAAAAWPPAGFDAAYFAAVRDACLRLGAARAQDHLVTPAEAAYAEADPVRRLGLLKKAFLGGKGEPYKPGWLFAKALVSALPDLPDRYAAAAGAVTKISDRLALFFMLEGTRAASTVGRQLNARNEQLKRGRGFSTSTTSSPAPTTCCRAPMPTRGALQLEQAIDPILSTGAGHQPRPMVGGKRLGGFLLRHGARDGWRTVFAVATRSSPSMPSRGARFPSTKPASVRARERGAEAASPIKLTRSFRSTADCLPPWTACSPTRTRPASATTPTRSTTAFRRTRRLCRGLALVGAEPGGGTGRLDAAGQTWQARLPCGCRDIAGTVEAG